MTDKNLYETDREAAARRASFAVLDAYRANGAELTMDGDELAAKLVDVIDAIMRSRVDFPRPTLARRDFCPDC